MRPFVLALCVFAITAAAFAQQQPPGRYRLERIVVEGSRVDDTVVRGEARLEEERTYGDEDFRQAVYRIRRLPFVTDAVYRLEPGVTAGGTTLVIRILDVTPVFYDFTGSGVRLANGDTVRDGSALIGGRWHLNNLGVIEGAVEKSDNSDGINLGLAYRAYDIMGTGGFATVAIAQRFKTKLRDYDPSFAATAGYPLTQRQTVTLSVAQNGSSVTRNLDVNGDDDTDDDDDTDREDNLDLTNSDTFNFASLRWWYETIDDPLFATRGVQISAGPSWSQSEFSFQNYDPGTKKIVPTELASEAYGLGFDASAYRALFGRTVGFIQLSGNGTRQQETEDETRSGTARAGLAFDFHSHADNVLRPFKARLEIGAAYHATQLSRPDLPGLNDNNTAGEVAFVLRHRWGTVRLFGTYLND
jgi:outer membrane protein assembly factor BamA